MPKIVTKFLDILFFVFGMFIFVYNLFDIKHTITFDSGPIAYYYIDSTQVWIAVGASFIIFGFLRKYWDRTG